MNTVKRHTHTSLMRAELLFPLNLRPSHGLLISHFSGKKSELLLLLFEPKRRFDHYGSYFLLSYLVPYNKSLGSRISIASGHVK